MQRFGDLMLGLSVLRGDRMLADQQKRLVGRDVPADALALEPFGVERRAAVADDLGHQIDPRAADDVNGVGILAEPDDAIGRIAGSPGNAGARAW